MKSILIQYFINIITTSQSWQNTYCKNNTTNWIITIACTFSKWMSMIKMQILDYILLRLFLLLSATMYLNIQFLERVGVGIGWKGEALVCPDSIQMTPRQPIFQLQSPIQLIKLLNDRWYKVKCVPIFLSVQINHQLQAKYYCILVLLWRKKF